MRIAAFFAFYTSAEQITLDSSVGITEVMHRSAYQLHTSQVGRQQLPHADQVVSTVQTIAMSAFVYVGLLATNCVTLPQLEMQYRELISNAGRGCSRKCTMLGPRRARYRKMRPRTPQCNITASYWGGRVFPRRLDGLRSKSCAGKSTHRCLPQRRTRPAQRLNRLQPKSCVCHRTVALLIGGLDQHND